MKLNTAIQTVVLMLSRITTRLHQDTGRFWAARFEIDELTDVKRLGHRLF